jgi:GT2 family glycosyltransferase
MKDLKQDEVIIVMLNYNGWLDTISCLESINKLEGMTPRVVVVDNCSTDNSWKELQNWSLKNNSENQIGINTFINENDNIPTSTLFNHKAVFIKAERNNGYSAGNNIGIKFILKNEIEFTYIWFLNNDTEVAPNSLKYLRDSFDKKKREKKLGILGSKLVYSHDRNKIQCLGGAKYNPFWGLITDVKGGQPVDRVYSKVKFSIDYVNGASMLVDKNFIKDVGLMEETYFLYYEEIDWCLRGKARDWEIDYEEKAIVYHKVGATTGYTHDAPKQRNPLLDYYYCRNKIIVAKKFYTPFHFTTIHLWIMISIFVRIFRQETKMIPYIIRAIKDGNKMKILKK